jgi:hypothetical protein
MRTCTFALTLTTTPRTECFNGESERRQRKNEVVEMGGDALGQCGRDGERRPGRLACSGNASGAHQVRVKASGDRRAANAPARQRPIPYTSVTFLILSQLDS